MAVQLIDYLVALALYSNFLQTPTKWPQLDSAYVQGLSVSQGEFLADVGFVAHQTYQHQDLAGRQVLYQEPPVADIAFPYHAVTKVRH